MGLFVEQLKEWSGSCNGFEPIKEKRPLIEAPSDSLNCPELAALAYEVAIDLYDCSTEQLDDVFPGDMYSFLRKTPRAIEAILNQHFQLKEATKSSID